MRIDHVIYATRDLDAAAARMENELGLAVVEGGRHDGMGTRNKIVPLGGGYLELLAVADPDEAAGSDLGTALLERLDAVGDGLLGWAVAVDDVDPIAARLSLPVTTISREGLTARLAGIADATREPYLPFFIARDHGVTDPGAGADAGGITALELSGDEKRLDRWLDGAPLPVRFGEGPPGVLSVDIGVRELR
jgi:catechol 2,3-dioxygenase-like lactoylglutathione lyase family enzyme